MFGRKHKGRRSINIVFVIFRLILSLVMFAVLLAGIYSAYKHFSGLDPLRLDPQALLQSVLEAKTPQQLLTVLSSVKFTQDLSSQINQKALPRERQALGDSTTRSSVAFKFMLVADSHSDNVNLRKAIAQAKQTYPDLAFIIGMGDYTEVGTIEEFKAAKKEFDAGGLRYFLLAGDHDLWDSRNKSVSPDNNFKQIFGPLYQAFTFGNYRFLLLDNSDNYQGIGIDQQKWITSELEKVKSEGISGLFVFVHEPLFHPSSDHFMGRVEKEVRQQARSLIYQLKDAQVKRVFSGDIHYFSQYSEPETGIEMVTIGAITVERNPQVPRFAVVNVFEDGSVRVEDVEIR